MSYYYHSRGKEYSFFLPEKEHCHPIYIKKRFSYQDPASEEVAMIDLTPSGFVAHCFLSIKASDIVWVVSLDMLPFDQESEAQAAMNELLAKGYLNKTTLKVWDDDGEVIELPGYVFTERSSTFRRRSTSQGENTPVIE